MSCDLDPVNLCCWIHGCDITDADYMEGYCAMGDIDDDFQDDDDFCDDDQQDIDTSQIIFGEDVVKKKTGTGKPETGE